MSLLTKVELKNHGVTTDTVSAIGVGPFAVFGHGNVTHAPTGYAVKTDCCCLIHAVSLAEQLAALNVDWNQPHEAFQADPQRAPILLIIRTSKCPNGCGR